jgi:ribosomal protein L11 methyltransferase
MSQNYLEYNFKVSPLQPGTEILIAELGLTPFESFVETEDGVKAYIQKVEWKETVLDEIRILKSEEFDIRYDIKEIEQMNWNQEWENNFTPIIVDGRCMVRAPFHQENNVEFDIVIEPKMSFGTGHHETTFMMLEFILENDLNGKRVLDMGCGTAVLAILSEMKGASYIDAVDIDEWCYHNSLENVGRNQCEHIHVYQGDISTVDSNRYDMILANINRNILLQDMESYSRCLSEQGALFLSGFYASDLEDIIGCCESHGLRFVEKKLKNDWVSAKFVF